MALQEKFNPLPQPPLRRPGALTCRRNARVIPEVEVASMTYDVEAPDQNFRPPGQ